MFYEVIHGSSYGPARRRWPAAAAALALHVALVAALMQLHVPALPGTAPSTVVAYAVPAPTLPQPRPVERPREDGDGRASREEGAAAPAAPHARPTPVAAAEPLKPLPEPEVAAAPAPGDGRTARAGAADVGITTGAGAGGIGQGSGAGLSGLGAGGGGAGLIRARWQAGVIRDRDYPAGASRRNAGGTVVAHFDVQPDGRVAGCRVVQSSGNPDLDATTCRLIEARFRYTPARDAAGNPVADVAGWRQDWWMERRR